MQKARYIAIFSVLLALAFILSLIPPLGVDMVSASPGMMVWSIVDTPNSDPAANVIASLSEVNVIAIGSDDMTFYAVDIPNGNLHKSVDGGVSWSIALDGYLTSAGANLPVWNLAIAPDDLNFLVAVTDGGGGNAGPKEVFISSDGGANWERAITGLTLTANECISCVDISVIYSSNNRDIALGTRDGGTGTVWALKVGLGTPGWVDQVLPASDVVALKFSPTYPSDSSLVAVSSSAGGTFLRVGWRDIANNTTNWAIWGVPVNIRTTGVSPTAAQIIVADLELPSDFSGQNSSLRRFYISTDTTVAGVEFGVFRVDNTVPYNITPPTTGRISSIAYLGTYSEGILLAGEVTAAELAPTPSSFGAYIWRTLDPNALIGTPTWITSDARRSPTGGAAGSGLANAQVKWSPNGERAYCGTSSACLGAFVAPDGAINCAAPDWPDGYLNGVALDESAFSVSPYTPAYGQLLSNYGKNQDVTIGNIWNQLSLIDTEISFLSDVAALEAPEIGRGAGAFEDYNVLYLFSINDNISVSPGFDSLWRSTSDPLGKTWERILCIATSDAGAILRVRQTDYDEEERSDVIVFADLGTEVIGYSADEGQMWDIRFFTTVTDLALAAEQIMYILNDTLVYRYIDDGAGWVQTDEADTQLEFGHTIAVPLKNPPSDLVEIPADWVIVGEAGPPGGYGRVVYANFAEPPVNFEPPISQRLIPPVNGNAHIITDDLFQANKTIYNAVHDFAGVNGKIYRQVIGSPRWEELEPPNSAFYGLAQRNGVLYGTWINAEIIGITSDTGADRTLYPKAYVPPPPEWDYLAEGLPTGVIFTREPNSLKISSNAKNTLWAIDDRNYDWTNRIGCLWSYDDIISRSGPWTTTPASGDFIPVDPVSGRASEVNFRWRQLPYASEYELQIAKDRDFSTVLLRNEHIVPIDQLAPECYFPAGGLVPTDSSASGVASWGNLEVGHTYFWRVRARATTTGEVARSPWSATMYFTVEAGLPVVAPYPTVTLFTPTYGARGISRSPSFAWSPMPRTTEYEFVLAKDAALQQVVVKVNVPLTAYSYDGELDYNATYFWQVRALEPVVSDPSAIGSFTVLVEEKPGEATTGEAAPIPFWVWWVIGVWGVLLAAIIAFAMVKPSYIRPRAGGKLTELEPIVAKPQNHLSKMWNAITMRIKRARYLRKRESTSSLDKLGE